MIINRSLSTLLSTTLPKYYFSGIMLVLNQKKLPKNDLSKYNIIIVGGSMGTLLAYHLHGVHHYKNTMFMIDDNPLKLYPIMRDFYQKKQIQKFKYQFRARVAYHKVAPSSQLLPAVQYLPQQNAVVLKNGRKVFYDQLVIACGTKIDTSIKGFQQAWSDLNHQFHTIIDHNTWRYRHMKTGSYHFNFNGGNAYFYIPPYPFHGQLQNYNFFFTKEILNLHQSLGKFSWLNSKFTIINANNTFCQYHPQLDKFIKQHCQKSNIHIQYGLKLKQVIKEKQIAIFQNQKGQLIQKNYDKFYSLAKSIPQKCLADAGLAAPNGFLDVDQHTLQHKKYPNIFGLGDINNLPTTKTFWSCWNQLHVVRNNISRNLAGLSLNAKYDGYTKAYMDIGKRKGMTVSHYYDQRSDDKFDAFHTGTLAYIRSFLRGHQKKQIWGPPYYKLKKTFPQTDSTNKTQSSGLHPVKKTV